MQWLEGVVRASRYDPDPGRGKQFLGVTIEGAGGRVFVIDYGELSPYHAFVGREVAVSGDTSKPDPAGQIVSVPGVGAATEHFCVSFMRLLRVAADAPLIEVGEPRRLHGRFDHRASGGAAPRLCFVADGGDALPVANDPPGATVGPELEVLAYPALRQRPDSAPPEPCLWIICPHSAAQLQEWRRRHP